MDDGWGMLEKPSEVSVEVSKSRHGRVQLAAGPQSAFVGLNLVLKPLVDELFMRHLSELALSQDDYLLGQIFYSLNEDCQWHRQWSESLV